MLARDLGEDIEQNPPPTSSGKNPDYRIPADTGEYCDAYSPTGANVKNIGDVVIDKVGQAPNIVVNLKNSSASARAIAEYIQTNAPIQAPGLQTVLIYDQVGKLFQVNLR